MRRTQPDKQESHSSSDRMISVTWGRDRVATRLAMRQVESLGLQDAMDRYGRLRVNTAGVAQSLKYDTAAEVSTVVSG